MAEGYCVKERKKVEIKDPQQVTMKNGRPAIQGTCPDCGTKILTLQTQVAANAAAKAAAPPSTTTTATTPGGAKKP